MESLTSANTKIIDNTIIKNTPTPELMEFMNFMAELPNLPSQFSADGNIGGDFNKITGLDDVDLEGTSPYTPSERDKLNRKKIDLNNPIVKKVISSIESLNLNAKDKDYLITLGNRESGLNPHATQGSFKGLYQFNKDSLKTVGIPEAEYRTDLIKQHIAALKYKSINLKILEKYKKYIGTVFKGIPITENGMAAAAHLLGAGTVMDLFDGTKHSARARKGFVDGLGTHISEYFKLFA